MGDPVISTTIAIMLSINYCDAGQPTLTPDHDLQKMTCADGSKMHRLELRVGEGHNCRMTDCDVDTLFSLLRDGELIYSVPAATLLTLKERQELNKEVQREFKESTIPLHIKP